MREREGKPNYDERLKLPSHLAETALWLDRSIGKSVAGPEFERAAGRCVHRPAPITSRGYAAPQDLQAFFVSVETGSAARMTGALRDLGYKGGISTFNNWPTIQTTLSRKDLGVVTMNTYQDWVGSYSPGATMTQKSSIEDGAGYMRLIAAARWLGNPFVVSEYDHLFWNRYR